MFTYTHKTIKVKGFATNVWTVKIDGKETGRIHRGAYDTGFQYRPKGYYAQKHANKGVWGEVFVSMNQVRKSIEGDD